MWITSLRCFRIIFHLTPHHLSVLSLLTQFSQPAPRFSPARPSLQIHISPLFSPLKVLSPSPYQTERPPHCSREAFPREPFFFSRGPLRARMLRGESVVSLSGPVSQWRNASASGSRFDRFGEESFRSSKRSSRVDFFVCWRWKSKEKRLQGSSFDSHHRGKASSGRQSR